MAKKFGDAVGGVAEPKWLIPLRFFRLREQQNVIAAVGRVHFTHFVRPMRGRGSASDKRARPVCGNGHRPRAGLWRRYIPTLGTVWHLVRRDA